MPQRKSTKKQKSTPKTVRNFVHEDATRKNLPTPETAGYMGDQHRVPTQHIPEIRDPGGSARLSWQRNVGLDNIETLATPLYIQEKIHPSAFVQSLEKHTTNDQLALFKDFNNLPKDAALQWYKYDGNWQNRIIRGSACNVMTSLIEKEHMAGEVQMVYCDPPYGIGFKSNMQVTTNKRESKSSKSGLPNDPGVIRTFRDQYENGLHSYLDNIYRVATHARELMAESGSFFLQIGQANVHKLAVLLDEVFGEENHIATIPFLKSGGSSAKLIPQSHDYLLWYSKEKEKIKYNNVYLELKTKVELIEHMSSYARIEQADGSARNLINKERDNLDNALSEGEQFFQRTGLTSQGHSTTGRSEPYVWNGITYHCPQDSHWRVSHEGLDELARKNRLDATPTGSLRWRQYAHEIPGNRINSLWAKQMNPNDLHYVVETAESVIERCILMATDPGDLVLDTTCGSGTTAYVAEKWGRRWITCDVGAVAISLARQRLISGVFDWQLLQDSPEGAKREKELASELSGKTVSTSPPPPPPPHDSTYNHDPAKGFVYRRFPHVTAKTLAYNEEKDPILLVNQPEIDGSITRVCSPFTVESHSPHRYLAPAEILDGKNTEAAMAQIQNFRKKIVSALETAGVRTSTSDGADRIRLSDIQPHVADPLTHTAWADELGFKVAIAIAPEDCTVPALLIDRAAETVARMPSIQMLIIIAFAYDADAQPETPESRGRFQIVKAQAHRDLQIEELKDNALDNAFVQVAEPDVHIEPEKGSPDQFTVKILGYDCYDPIHGNLREGNPTDVDCWMIDTNYSGLEFMARRVHFPNKEKDKQLKRLQNALANQIDPKLWDSMLSLKSAPFPRPESGRIAVRIVLNTLGEMMTVRDIP